MKYIYANFVLSQKFRPNWQAIKDRPSKGMR